MNEKGELWVEGVNKLTRRYLPNDPVRLQKSEKFTEECKSGTFLNNFEQGSTSFF